MARPFDIDQIRNDFPILHTEVKGKPLVYLDNAATAQKPTQVLEASRHYYEEYNSNIHRGTHHLSQLATARHEEARQKIANFLNVTEEEVIFTSGATDGINLVASILEDSGLFQKDDLILVSGLEHHSNIVPWQLAATRTGAKVVPIPVLDNGTLDQEAYQELLSKSPKVVAVNQVSNAFGTINPVKEMISQAHEVGALVLLDGAQSVPHGRVDLKDLGADFFVFSGHKVYAPTGTGILYGKKELLEKLPPYRGGGEMIKEVSFEGTTFNDLPFKYEAGTPNIEGGIALAAALDYMDELDREAVINHEYALVKKAAEVVSDVDGIKLYGPDDRIASLSFSIDGAHHYDVGTLIDNMGVAVRTGHHCCQPLMHRFGITGTIRASFAFYNTLDEIDTFAESLEKAVRLLK